MTAAASDQMPVLAGPSWRHDLSLLAMSTRVADRHYAADAFLLASLAEQVPAPQGTGARAPTWQSFLREVAVVRGLQDGAAVREVQRAQPLAHHLPSTVEQLSCGSVTVLQAVALCDELVGVAPRPRTDRLDNAAGRVATDTTCNR